MSFSIIRVRLRLSFFAKAMEDKKGGERSQLMSEKEKIIPRERTTDENQNLLGALTYLLGFITGIIFLVIEKKNDYIRFHALQSVAVFAPLMIILVFLSTFFGALGVFLNFIVSVLVFIIWIFLMYKAFSGEKYKVPYIGQWVEKQLKNL